MEKIYKLEIVQKKIEKPLDIRLGHKIKSSEDIYDLFKEYFHLKTTEALIVVYLSRALEILGFSEISQGNICSTEMNTKKILQGVILADEKKLWQDIIKSNCPSIMLVHNHLTKTIEPSPQDEESTQKIIDACKLLDVFVLDHMIIGLDGYYSMRIDGKGGFKKEKKVKILNK